jgi:hypothetical protein
MRRQPIPSTRRTLENGMVAGWGSKPQDPASFVYQCFRLPVVSSLWTPDGERPINRPTDAGAGAAPEKGGSPGGGTAGSTGPAPDSEEAALAEQVAAMRAELANSPVEVVVANHCYGLFELAAVYLSQQPPMLAQARLAIDALGSLVLGLEGRLGDTEDQLKDGLSQLRLAYVQINGAQEAGAKVASAAGATPAGPSTPPGSAVSSACRSDWWAPGRTWPFPGS